MRIPFMASALGRQRVLPQMPLVAAGSEVSTPVHLKGGVHQSCRARCCVCHRPVCAGPGPSLVHGTCASNKTRYLTDICPVPVHAFPATECGQNHPLGMLPEPARVFSAHESRLVRGRNYRPPHWAGVQYGPALVGAGYCRKIRLSERGKSAAARSVSDSPLHRRADGVSPLAPRSVVVDHAWIAQQVL